MTFFGWFDVAIAAIAAIFSLGYWFAHGWRKVRLCPRCEGTKIHWHKNQKLEHRIEYGKEWACETCGLTWNPSLEEKHRRDGEEERRHREESNRLIKLNNRWRESRFLSRDKAMIGESEK